MKIFLSLILVLVTLFSKELTIESEDGFILHGWLDYPAVEKKSYPVILFAHQFGSDHTIWNELASELRGKGFATLMVDLRGHGKSNVQNGNTNSIVNDMRMDHIKEALIQSKKKVKFEKIPSDLAKWLDTISEVENLNMDKLALFGSSLGGGAILPLAIDYEPKVIVSISSGSGDETAINESLKFANTASLFIASKNDPLGAQNRVQDYAKIAMRGTSIIIPGSGHGTVLLPFVKNYIFLFLNNQF